MKKIKYFIMVTLLICTSKFRGNCANTRGEITIGI